MKFTGIPSGDGECFHFKVTQEEYKKIVGDEKYQQEVHWFEEMQKDNKEEGFMTCPLSEKEWILTPDDILSALGVNLDNKEQTTLEINVVKEPEEWKLSKVKMTYFKTGANAEFSGKTYDEVLKNSQEGLGVK